MKRLIAFLLCVVLCVSIASAGVWANTASLAEKVLVLLRSRIPDTSQYLEFTSSVISENDRTVYHFNWSNSDGEDYKGMYVSALEGGIITGFGINDGKTQTGDLPSGFDRITIGEAQSRTKELLKKLNPDIADKLSLRPIDTVEQFDAKNHTFEVIHTESGIPVYGDRGRVTVDINAQRIMSFNMTYTDNLAYPSAVKIVDLATAKDIFVKEIGVDLYYRVWNTPAGKEFKIYPMYSPKGDNVYVNANTGKAEKILPFNDNVFIKNESADMMAGGAGSMLGLTPAELKEIQNLKKLLTKAEAEAYVRKIKLLDISQDCTLEEFTTRRLSQIEELYGHSLVFLQKGEERDSYIFVDINAETGEVLSYSNFAQGEEAAELSAEDMAMLCDEAFKVLAPKKYTEYVLRQSDKDKHYATYDRFANGVRVDGNTASVEINSAGALASYRISYTNAKFPIYSDIISNEQASKCLFDTAGYLLLYIPQKSDASLKRPDKAVLIYDIDDYGICLDPYTGNRINSDGTEYIDKSQKEEYADISGHYAEAEIRALHRFGIGFASAEFVPDGVCLQKDFVTLLMSAFDSKSTALINDATSHKDYYTEAKRLGIITDSEQSPESAVSRMQAAKFICRALKIEKYAQLDKIFDCPFVDVMQDKGYVTMLWGMGIVNGTGADRFSPDADITRGQAAILIYNAMNNK